jgi:hypothetical protein
LVDFVAHGSRADGDDPFSTKTFATHPASNPPPHAARDIYAVGANVASSQPPT